MDVRRIVLLGVLAAAVAAFFLFDLGSYLTLDNLKARQGELQAWQAANPWLSVTVFFLIYVVVTALSLPGATVMTLAIGAIFGS